MVVGFSFYSDKSHLPWSLWMWGENQSLKALYFRLKLVPTKDLYRIEEFKRLFPEADITAD